MRRKMLLTVLLSFILFSCDSKSSQKNDLENITDHDDSDIIFSDPDFSDTDFNETDTNDESDINDVDNDVDNDIEEDIDNDTENYFAAPTNLIAEDGVSHNRILITWDELPNNPKVYIYRSEHESGPFENSNNNWTTGNSMSDENIIPGKKYYYKAKADYGLKRSEFSNMDSGFSLKDDSTYEFVLASGEEGNSWGEFQNPAGIKYNNEELVIADTGNSRIQFFDSGTLNSSGSIDKEFSPVGIGMARPAPYGAESVMISTGFSGEESFIDSVYNYQTLNFDAGTSDVKMLYGFAGSIIMWNIYGEEMSLLHVVDKGSSKIHVFKVLNNFNDECNSDYCIEYLKSFGTKGSNKGNMESPSGAAVTDNMDFWSLAYLFVADSGNDRINVYWMYSGELVFSFGSSGNNDGEFNNPTDITISENGYIFVTDSGNDRVQKFSLNGTFITKFGESGNGDGQFNNPTGITVDDEGNVYVVDTGNNRIQKFKPVP